MQGQIFEFFDGVFKGVLVIRVILHEKGRLESQF